LDEAVRLNPEHYAPYVLRGKFYLRVGEPERALESYRQAQALNPLDVKLSREVDELAAKIDNK
jgi:Tfp pilus assembly protein PilF